MNKIINTLVAVATDVAFRSVEVRRQSPESGGPVLVLANHGGGLGDILTVIAGCQRFPRFLARDIIWKFPIAKQVMNSVRAIPVSRRQDHGSSADNHGMFDAAFEGLATGDLLAIYPEGESVPEPRLAPLRTGAARILLGAWARGTDVTVEPMGLHYYDISVLRGRCLVQVGEPFRVSEVAAGLPEPLTEDNHESVKALTAILAERLNAVVAEYADWQTRRDLEAAAAVHLVGDGQDRGFGYSELASVADRLSRAPVEQQTAVLAAFKAYSAQVEVLGLKDGELPNLAMVGLQVANRLTELLVLAPLAAFGAVVNAVPMLGLRAISMTGVAPATAASVKPAFALVAFPATWALLGRWGYRRSGARGAGVMALTGPVSLAATVRVAEQGQLALLIARAYRRAKGPAFEQFVHARDILRGAVADALAADEQVLNASMSHT